MRAVAPCCLLLLIVWYNYKAVQHFVILIKIKVYPRRGMPTLGVTPHYDKLLYIDV